MYKVTGEIPGIVFTKAADNSAVWDVTHFGKPVGTISLGEKGYRIEVQVAYGPGIRRADFHGVSQLAEARRVFQHKLYDLHIKTQAGLAQSLGVLFEFCDGPLEHNSPEALDSLMRDIKSRVADLSVVTEYTSFILAACLFEEYNSPDHSSEEAFEDLRKLYNEVFPEQPGKADHAPRDYARDRANADRDMANTILPVVTNETLPERIKMQALSLWIYRHFHTYEGASDTGNSKQVRFSYAVRAIGSVLMPDAEPEHSMNVCMSEGDRTIDSRSAMAVVEWFGYNV